MASVSTFFTGYSAMRGGARVEAIAVVLEGEGSAATIGFIVVDEDGRASLASADEIDLYGVIEEAEEAERAEEAEGLPQP